MKSMLMVNNKDFLADALDYGDSRSVKHVSITLRYDIPLLVPQWE